MDRFTYSPCIERIEYLGECISCGEHFTDSSEFHNTPHGPICKERFCISSYARTQGIDPAELEVEEMLELLEIEP